MNQNVHHSRSFRKNIHEIKRHQADIEQIETDLNRKLHLIRSNISDTKLWLDDVMKTSGHHIYKPEKYALKSCEERSKVSRNQGCPTCCSLSTH